MADQTPYHAFTQLSAKQQAEATNVNDLFAFSKFPVSIRFVDPIPEFDHDISDQYFELRDMMHIWYHSTGRTALLGVLREMKSTPRITNIVCIGHGSFAQGPRSMMQHVVASWIASTLTKIYADAGDPVIEPITIIAQDPMYIKKDRDLLSNLANPIDVVFDPQAFLAINSSSLVMSVQPLVPVKAIVADLDVLPAVMFWNQPWDHETYSTVDRVQIDVGNGIPILLNQPNHGTLGGDVGRLRDDDG
jgi:hypothetical protein